MESQRRLEHSGVLHKSAQSRTSEVYHQSFNMFGIFDAENEMDLSAAYTEVHIATLLSFGMNFMQVKFTKVNKVTAGQEMEDLWGGLSIPWSRCKCHRGIS